MPLSVDCLCCQDPLAERIRLYRLSRQSDTDRFTPTLELLAKLFPDPERPGHSFLNECCVGQFLTFVDNSARINSYNPQKTIHPYLRITDERAAVECEVETEAKPTSKTRKRKTTKSS